MPPARPREARGRRARALSTALAACALAGAGCADGTGAIGAPCAEKDECADGLCLQSERYGEETGWSGGYCTAPCDGGAGCPDGATCMPLAEGERCLASCATSDECRAGYLCAPGPAACVPDCRLGLECVEGASCGPAGLCVPDDPPTSGCVVDADCDATCPPAAARGCLCLAPSCLPRCDATADCPQPLGQRLVCDPVLGWCVPDRGGRGPGPGRGG